MAHRAPTEQNKQPTTPVTLTIHDDPVPIEIDQDGEARVGGTRVTLTTIIGSFKEGASAEEIALRYSAVSLADIYSVIAYYLHYRAEVDAYLQDRDALEDETRRQNEARFNLAAV